MDSFGFGAAQPDVLVIQPELLWIFECKLTHTVSAESQVRELYLPLVEYIWPEREYICSEVCYNLDGVTPDVRELGGLLETRREFAIYHWMR